MTKLTYDIYENNINEQDEGLKPLIHLEILGLEKHFESNLIDPANSFMDFKMSLEEINVQDPRIIEKLKDPNNPNLRITDYVIKTDNKKKDKKSG
jgi:hypothetical protein